MCSALWSNDLKAPGSTLPPNPGDAREGSRLDASET